MMTHGAAIKEAILKDDTLMKSRHCWCVYFELIKFAHVGKKLQTQKGANKQGPSCSVPPFTRWTVTIVTRVLWPAPLSPLFTPPQLYLFILRTLLSIALKQSWCSTVPSSADWGTALTHYHHYQHLQLQSPHSDMTSHPLHVYQAVISSGQSA